MKLSASDEKKLVGCHPDLVRLLRRTAELNTTVPFTIMETSRTVAQQRINVARHVSQTMNSRHIPGKDGFAKAADLVPLVNGKPAWSWPVIYKMQEFTRKAARDLGIKCRWGGVWDMLLTDLKGNLEHEQAAYVQRQRAKRRGAFADGPHIELDKATYP